MAQSSLRKPQFWLGILISVACLAATFFFIEPQQVFASLRDAQIGFVLLTVLWQTVYLWLRAVRWRFMLDGQITTLRTFHLQNVGFMMTQLLPLRIGDPARAILVGSEPRLTIGQGLSTMVVERVLDMLAIVVLLPFALTQVEALPDWMRSGAQLSGYLAIAGIAVVIVAANIRPKIRQLTTFLLDRIPFLDTNTWATQIDNLLAGLHTFTNWRSGSQLLIYSILPWIPVILAYQSAMQAVGLSPTMLQTGFVVCACALSIAAPSSPGQVGVFHAAATFAVTALGMDENAGISFAFIYHALNFTMMVLLGLFALSQTQSSFQNVLQQTRTFMQQRSAPQGGV